MYTKQVGKLTHPYTCGDAFYQLLRLAVLGTCLYVTWQITMTFTTDRKITYIGLMRFIAILLGGALYWLANQIFNQFMWLAFGCEALLFHDYSFLLEEEVNRHMIIGVGIFE